MILLNPRKPGKVIRREYKCELCERNYPMAYTTAKGEPGNMRASRIGGMTLIGLVCSRCRRECKAIRDKWTR